MFYTIWEYAQLRLLNVIFDSQERIMMFYTIWEYAQSRLHHVILDLQECLRDSVIALRNRGIARIHKLRGVYIIGGWIFKSSF